jgi:hypothetical protein
LSLAPSTTGAGVGLIVGALIFAMEVTVPLLIGWAVVHSRKPLWIRWGAGATAYVAYAGLAGVWLPTMWSGLVVAFSAGMFNAILLGTPATEAPALASRLTRLDIVARAWVAFALVPALVFAVAHYARRLVVARGALARQRR